MNSKKESLWSKVSTFLVFAGPATFAFLAVVIVPFLYGVYLTFTSWDGVSSNKPFVGLKNYAAVVADSSFWQSLGLTLLYVVVSVILVNVIGFLLALLVTGKIKGKNFFRAGFFTPNLIGGIILHQGRIAEMRTGEGKTLVSTLPAYLNALEEKGVHILSLIHI